MRKHLLLGTLTCLALTILHAQPNKPGQRKPVDPSTQKKYPSLLWEISGNGLRQPSYLFGTMHVSDKLAFHLGDSFYNAIKKAEVVALETNPENWQDDFSKSSRYNRDRGRDEAVFSILPSEFAAGNKLTITSFSIDSYDEAMKAALAMEPSLINGMLYRTYGTRMDDFEEDTYLDLYIFQTGKKLGKKLTGVENFEESEKLVKEAYKDMMKDRNKKRRSFDFEGMYTNPKKLEDAYRRGDLDLLDSLETMTVFSDAFQEKFLYKRNEIQANSIDSIIKKSVLFVGVGAAHLPGKRGVIEMLRQKGYTLRPIRMDERNSIQKEKIEKTRSVSAFYNQIADDGFFEVKIPGRKFYRFTDWTGMDVVQYADMVNGAYYMVTRIKTNSLSWGHTPSMILRKIDSVLYENIPGKILKKTAIMRNGYKGWEIQNRTRRGDYQRYNIYVTPFEIVVFKMSGTGEYINYGSEAQQFFGSVKMKNYDDIKWDVYKSPEAGFTALFPHSPILLKDVGDAAGRLEYTAVDKTDGNSYLVLKNSFHNYHFLEEDSFELNLLSESYAFSGFIEKEVSRKVTTVNGYPALECRFAHKDQTFSSALFVIRGPVYYMAAVHHKSDNENAKRFLKSFSIKPFIYAEAREQQDTSMYFTVQSPIPIIDKKKDDEWSEMLEAIYSYSNDDDDDPSYLDKLGKYRTIGNDSIGEKIVISYNAPEKYTYIKDSTELWEKGFGNSLIDSSFIYKKDTSYTLANGIKCRDLLISDTGSSRVILGKWIYRDGHKFMLTTLTDTIGVRSSFLEKFFATFQPVDTLRKESLFTRKSEIFFNDYFSSDSATAKKAHKLLYSVAFDSLDVPLLKKAIERLNWKSKAYLSTKEYFINELADQKDSSIAPFLKNLYWKVRDSADQQNVILRALLKQKTLPAFQAFQELITQEPPILDDDGITGMYYPLRFSFGGSLRTFISPSYASDNVYFGKWSPLYDTLDLTKQLFPGMLQLLNVDDYKQDMITLLTVLVDSGRLKGKDYETYYSKLYLDGRQLLKKQVAREEKNNIEKASSKDSPLRHLYPYYNDDEEEMDNGNDNLEMHAILLMPFYDKNPGIPAFFDQLMKSKDKKLLFRISLLMLRHNKPVPDSFFMRYAKMDDYRVDLYKALEEMKKLDKFPAAYKTQQHIARSLFGNSSYSYSKPDTVAFVDKLPVTYEGKKGWVYFFKYREMRDDTYWKLATVGMQPENESEIDTDNTEFSSKEDRKLDPDKPEMEQMQKILKELLFSKRPSASGFYDAAGENIYKKYLSEIVKRRRYAD